MSIQKWFFFGLLTATVPLIAAQLKPETNQAFDRYAAQTEARLANRTHFLWIDEKPERAEKVKNTIVIEPFQGKAIHEVPSGLVHDWVGTVFIPGVTIGQVINFVQDYGNHSRYFKPEVVRSTLRSGRGMDFEVYMRLVKHQVVTVVLDTEHEVHYTMVDKTHWSSVSRTTSVSEVENAGKADEKINPPGTGNGFMWRLNSYWRFQERDGGVYVECQAISLSRDIPTGLNWIIQPIIRNLPRTSLENTLKATAAALKPSN